MFKWLVINLCGSRSYVLPLVEYRTKSMTISTAQSPISFIASLVLSVANSTLENQAVN